MNAAWRGVRAGFCATLLGIGLSRFAYTPLIPALARAHWFSADAVFAAGAANLAGYLAGALGARRAALRWGTARVLRIGMALVALSFLACAWPLPLAWFGAWRFVAGAAGAALIVLAAPAVLPVVPAAWRGRAGGIVFAGIGAGAVLSGTLVPLLVRRGLTACWLVLGALALLATMLAWRGWPAANGAGAAAPMPAGPPPAGLGRVYLQYALNAVAILPAMLFLVDEVVRGLGRGNAAGGAVWVAYGLGAMAGPLLAGPAVDRLGPARAFRWGVGLETLGVGLALVSHAPWALLASSAATGVFTPGMVLLVYARVQAMAPGEAGLLAWGRATAAFALAQAVAAAAFSWVFARTGSFDALAAAGVAALLLSLALEWPGRRAGA